MPVSSDGTLWQTSVSEIESADHKQDGGCMRKFWFDRRHALRGDQTRSQTEGEAGHAHLARYFETGELPKRRTLMSKAVTGAILKGELPKPGPDLLVETRFDGGGKYLADGITWRPLDVTQTLHIAGVPLDGFLDLVFRRGDVPEVWDHKFTSDLENYAKPSHRLIDTVQMPVYVESQVPYWPDAKQWRIVHHYVSKRGVLSAVRSAVVELDEVRERIADVTQVVERMKVYARAEQQDDVPANSTYRSTGTRACDQYGGCPHQSICRAYNKEGSPVELTPEEAAMFDGLDNDVAPEPVAAPPPAPAPLAHPEQHTPAPAEAPKVRRMAIVDVPAPGASATAVESVICACGATVTAENGSRLQDGKWKHIGCPLNKPATPPPAPPAPPAAPPAAAAPAPAPRQRKAKTESAPPLPPAAPAAAAPTPAPAATTPVQVPEVKAPAPTPAPTSETLAAFQETAARHIEEAALKTLASERQRRSLAALFRNIADLVEAA